MAMQVRYMTTLADRQLCRGAKKWGTAGAIRRCDWGRLAHRDWPQRWAGRNASHVGPFPCGPVMWAPRLSTRPVATRGARGGGLSPPLDKFEPPPRLPDPFAVTIGIEVYPPPGILSAPPPPLALEPLVNHPGLSHEVRATHPVKWGPRSPLEHRLELGADMSRPYMIVQSNRRLWYTS